jgi:hypothetical protein
MMRLSTKPDGDCAVIFALGAEILRPPRLAGNRNDLRFAGIRRQCFERQVNPFRVK